MLPNHCIRLTEWCTFLFCAATYRSHQQAAIFREKAWFYFAIVLTCWNERCGWNWDPKHHFSTWEGCGVEGGCNEAHAPWLTESPVYSLWTCDLLTVSQPPIISDWVPHFGRKYTHVENYPKHPIPVEWLPHPPKGRKVCFWFSTCQLALGLDTTFGRNTTWISLMFSDAF